MREKLLVGFALGMSILILVLFLNPLAGFFLGAVVCPVALFIAAQRYLVAVKPARALIVRSPLSKAVLRVVSGPTSTFVLPFREEASPVLDTSEQSQIVQVGNLLHRGQLATSFTFEVSVLYRLAPHALTRSKLGEVLPNLTDGLSTLLSSRTTYYLRRLVGDVDLDQSRNGCQRRLERHLHQLLAGELSLLGIAILGVQLVMEAPAGLQDALTDAERERVDIALQADRLAAILKALAGHSKEARSLAVLQLANALGRGGGTWTSVDLASFLNSINGASEQVSSSYSGAVPLAVELRQPVQASA